MILPLNRDQNVPCFRKPAFQVGIKKRPTNAGRF